MKNTCGREEEQQSQIAHRGDVICEEGVDAGEVLDSEVRQLAALVLGELHRRARDVVRLPEWYP